MASPSLLQRAQFVDLGLELGHRLFEIEIATHHAWNLQSEDEVTCGRAVNSPAHQVEVKKRASFMLFLRQRVQIAHQAFQALLQHVSINLRGRNIGVAEQRLHHAQVGAVVEKMAGKSVAQHVRA